MEDKLIVEVGRPLRPCGCPILYPPRAAGDAAGLPLLPRRPIALYAAQSKRGSRGGNDAKSHSDTAEKCKEDPRRAAKEREATVSES